MKITPLNRFIYSHQSAYNHDFCHNTKSKSFDCVSFGQMRKSQFEGIDLLVVNKFKAPIEKFNSDKDFQKWCEDEIEKIKIPSAKNEIPNIKRKEKLEKWADYVQKNYGSAATLLVLKDITTSLLGDNNYMPPIIDEQIIKLEDIKKRIENNPKTTCNFVSLYKAYLYEKAIKEEKGLDENYCGWIIIPSQRHNPADFPKNVKKLITLSDEKWCTANGEAVSYLEEGDFHILMDRGYTVLGIAFYPDDSIDQIQGVKNDYSSER